MRLSLSYVHVVVINLINECIRSLAQSLQLCNDQMPRGLLLGPTVHRLIIVKNSVAQRIDILTTATVAIYVPLHKL